MFKIPTYKNPDVASLAWAIYSAPLLKDVTGISIVGETWCRDQFVKHEEWLRELDADPSPLQAHIARDAEKLLGKRFESLIAFWFEQSPHYELLGRNIVLSEDKNTRGEIDLLVRDKDDGELMHFEVACKYYIQLHQSRQWKDWPGPNGKDSLQNKISKLYQQVRIFQTSLGQSYLHTHHLKKPSSYAFVKGYFFHAYDNLIMPVPPNNAHPHYNSGWYVSLAELERFSGKQPQWLMLPKTMWMCPYHFLEEDQILLTGDELIESCRAEILRTQKAVMIVQVIRESGYLREISRGFVLKNQIAT